ncbi:MAG: hypothetical protein ACD_39C00052G0002, partial [uncultured bacterium]
MPTNSVCFRDLLLQQTASQHLSRSVASGRIAQTYLFTGSESCGR